jgi:hypothetical protein
MKVRYHVRLDLHWKPVVFNPDTHEDVAVFADYDMASHVADLLCKTPTRKK